MIVQKYGGSSLTDADKIKNVARRIIKAKKQDARMVIVVSAMGKTTDELIGLAHQVNVRSGEREFDRLLSTGEIVSSVLLAMTLTFLRHDCISLTGTEAGIITNNMYGRARIIGVVPDRIIKELDRGKIVIVAGFQGITRQGDITTLDRGGSDITAVILAIELGTKICEIYTDVEGIYTADPHIVPEARKLEQISYEEALELTSSGAKVIHPRAVEMGWRYKMPILVASSFNDNPGTIIGSF